MHCAFSSPVRNPDLLGFRCRAGGALLPLGDYFEGCPSSRALNRPTSVTGVYARYPEPTAAAGRAHGGDGRVSALSAVGGPRRGRHAAARLHAVRAPRPLLLKAEWMNPTGSHKDRASPLVVARAVEVGARGIAAPRRAMPVFRSPPTPHGAACRAASSSPRRFRRRSDNVLRPCRRYRRGRQLPRPLAPPRSARPGRLVSRDQLRAARLGQQRLGRRGLSHARLRACGVASGRRRRRCSSRRRAAI